MSHSSESNPPEFVRRVREPRAVKGEIGRHRARRSAMMLLYQNDVVGGNLEKAIDTFEDENGFEMPPYSVRIVLGVTQQQTQLDQEISSNLVDWTIDRLGSVERAVLRIALWELNIGEVPLPIVIDEAVELAKRYASPEAAKLVNGVLSGWLKDKIDEKSGGDES